MGITKTGPISLKAVREDVDLPAWGSITERAVRDKIQNNGSISLKGFAGNVLGIQYLTENKSEASWTKFRDRTTGLGYLMNNPQIWGGGGKVYVPCKDNYTSDIGVEARITGKVLESGSYTLSGSSFGEFDDFYRNGEMHINLIANASGYLVGVNNVLVNGIYNSTWALGNKNWTFNVSLTTSQPFITLILRNIHTSNGGRGTTTTHQFWNWTLGR